MVAVGLDEVVHRAREGQCAAGHGLLQLVLGERVHAARRAVGREVGGVRLGLHRRVRLEGLDPLPQVVLRELLLPRRGDAVLGLEDRGEHGLVDGGEGLRGRGGRGGGGRRCGGGRRRRPPSQRLRLGGGEDEDDLPVPALLAEDGGARPRVDADAALGRVDRHDRSTDLVVPEVDVALEVERLVGDAHGAVLAVRHVGELGHRLADDDLLGPIGLAAEGDVVGELDAATVSRHEADLHAARGGGLGVERGHDLGRPEEVPADAEADADHDEGGGDHDDQALRLREAAPPEIQVCKHLAMSPLQGFRVSSCRQDRLSRYAARLLRDGGFIRQSRSPILKKMTRQNITKKPFCQWPFCPMIWLF